MKGFKTVALGLALLLLAGLNNPEVQAFIHANLPAAEAALGVAVIALRALTSSPIFKK